MQFPTKGAILYMVNKVTGKGVGENVHSFFCKYRERIRRGKLRRMLPVIEKVVRILSRKETYEQKAEELIQPIVEGNGFELVDVEYVKEGGNWYLRAYIDKEGGITVDDCEVVSRAFSDLLDENDFIEEAYILEVSSPGLGRPLRKEKDYRRSMGKELEIRTYRAVDRSKEFYGILTAYDDDSVTIEEEDGTKRTFAKADIALIRLAFDF